MREVVEADLNNAVADLTKDIPIATSTAVKGWLTKHGIDWDVDGRGGGLLEQVDRDRMKGPRPLHLQKWKAPGGENALVGWAEAGSAEAERWAAQEKWDRLDLLDGRWTRVDRHGIPLL